MLWETMYGYLKSFFVYEGLSWELLLLSLGLALAFGAVWLIAYWSPWLKHPPLWLVMIAGALITVLALTFIQIPLQHYVSKAMTQVWGITTLNNWLLLAGIPSVLLSGLVQEGAKMVPMVAWWWRSGKTITPGLGIAIGAAAGAGFGIFEALWGISGTFLAGWTTDVVTAYGWFLGISSFWERFFTAGAHIAFGAIAGYGLAKGKGWQFYLIAALLHALFNYSIVIYQYFAMVKGSNLITPTRIEIFIAVFAVIVTAIVLLIRWRKEHGPYTPEPVEPSLPAPELPPVPANPPEAGA